MKRALTSALIALVLPGMGGVLLPDAQARDLRADEPDRLAGMAARPEPLGQCPRLSPDAARS